MKKETLKLDYIEAGRLVNGEMSEIVGGAALEKCGTLTECPQNETNKRTCKSYKDCDSVIDKFKCSNYLNFVVLEMDEVLSCSTLSMTNLSVTNLSFSMR